MLKKYVEYLILIVFSLVILSCHSRDIKTTQSKQRELQQLLDQGLYDDAILESQKVLEQNPFDEQVHLILATAFAGKAGIEFNQVLSTVEAVRFMSTVDFHQISFESNPEKISISSIKNDSLKIIKNLNLIRESFKNLPNLDSTNLGYLRSALYELKQIKKQNSQKTFHAILTVIYLKNSFDLQSEFINSKIDKISNNEKSICVVDVLTLTNWAIDFAGNFIDLNSDLSYLLPKDTNKIDAFNVQIIYFQKSIRELNKNINEHLDSGSCS